MRSLWSPAAYADKESVMQRFEPSISESYQRS